MLDIENYNFRMKKCRLLKILWFEEFCNEKIQVSLFIVIIFLLILMIFIWLPTTMIFTVPRVSRLNIIFLSKSMRYYIMTKG